MVKESAPVIRPKEHILSVKCRVHPDSLLAEGERGIS